MATESNGIKLHKKENASTIPVENVVGSHRLKIMEYSFQRYNGEVTCDYCLTSVIFSVGGYDWVIKYYSNGCDNSSRGHLSFFLELRSEDTDVQVQLNFTMLDQSNIPKLFSRTLTKTFERKGSDWGYPKYVERDEFENSSCLNNDSFEIICTVAILKESTKFQPVIIPPSDLNLHLLQLFETGKGADVIFQVGEEIFKAHKIILAARSRVFDAQFFGLMSEKGNTIILDDIEPEVFRVFLHFVYSDSLPELEEKDSVMYQHLLVASDRYEVERLKLICENKLSQNIENGNFATTLTLAEQHNCAQLKASCFKYVSSLEILAGVVNTDEFEHLIRSCPSILKDLINSMIYDK